MIAMTYTGRYLFFHFHLMYNNNDKLKYYSPYWRWRDKWMNKQKRERSRRTNDKSIESVMFHPYRTHFWWIHHTFQFLKCYFYAYSGYIYLFFVQYLYIFYHWFHIDNSKEKKRNRKNNKRLSFSTIPITYSEKEIDQKIKIK